MMMVMTTMMMMWMLAMMTMPKEERKFMTNVKWEGLISLARFLHLFHFFCSGPDNVSQPCYI